MAFSLDIDFAVEDDAWPDGLQPVADKVIRTALKLSKAEITGPAELSILLTNDAGQRQLNRQWRQKDSATNVLSFPQLPPFSPLSGLVGDVSLAHEALQREAKELGKTFDHHFTHLLVHGFLHCLGYDHETDQEALVMERLESDILAQLGIDDPYAEIADT